MRYASIGNVLLAIFSANSLFIVFLNRAKIPFVIAIVGVLIIAVSGVILGQELGDERIIFAYVAGAGCAAIASTVYALRITKTSAMRLLARYS
jgi:hydrogenase/urease accessory protein HupE